MKILSILSLAFTTGLFAQTSTSWLMSGLNTQPDVNSCYKPTPALVMQAGQNQVLFQSTDGGTTWMDLTAGLPDKIQPGSVFSKDGAVYIGTLDARLFYNANPATGNWEEQKLEGLSKTSFITGIFECKSGVYVAIHDGGIFKHAPGNKTWVPLHKSLPDKSVHGIYETRDGNLMVACPSGIYKSTNEGKIWNHVYAKGWVSGISAYAGTILATTTEGIVRSEDDGETWKCIVADVGALFKTNVIDGYFIAIRQAGGWKSATANIKYVIISKDKGETWQQMDGGQPADSEIYDLEKIGDYLYSSRSAGISRSNDFGKTWQLLITPPEADMPYIFELVSSGSILFAMMRTGGC